MSNYAWGDFDSLGFGEDYASIHRPPWGRITNPERYTTVEQAMRGIGLRSPSWWERLRGIR